MPDAAFRAAAERLGLHALPLGPAYEARAEAGVRLQALAPWARGGLLLLSYGSGFVDDFLAAGGGDGPDPLDQHTRARVEGLIAPLRARGLRAEARWPFWNEPDPLPFQRIGMAAGLGPPSRLGLQLHATYGSWIAYRALVLLDRAVDDCGDQTAHASCAACAAPCISACPAGAFDDGFDFAACFDRRLDVDPCGDGCRARLACPVGADRRYAPAALRFHQAASLAAASAWRRR